MVIAKQNVEAATDDWLIPLWVKAAVTFFALNGGVIFVLSLLSSMANLFIKELLGIHGILTVSSFFRLYRTPALKKLQVTYGPDIVKRSGFECMVEMTMKMANLQITISEVPMVLDTRARVGKSRMKIAKTSRGYLSLWLEIAAH